MFLQKTPLNYFSLIVGLLVGLGGCFWTPQIHTELHNSSRGTVSLRTIENNSLRGDHPVTMNTETMVRLLEGAHKFRDPRLVEGLLTNDDQPKPLFSPRQVKFLAPLLTSALSQATPEEEVYFECASDYKGAPSTIGRMLVSESTLFFTWNEPLSKPSVLSKQHRRTAGLMDPSMPQGHMITFFPREAIRVESDSTKYYLKRLGENTLAIDYEVLAGLPKSVFDIPELQGTAEGKTVKEGQNLGESPRNAETQTSTDPSSSTPRNDQNLDLNKGKETGAESDIRALRKQMEDLQKEVDEQQRELDRLKKDQR